MARRVRVASRAVRRGRRLQARPSELPPAPSDDSVTTADDEAPISEPAPTPDTRRLDGGEAPAARDDAANGDVARSQFSRPAAPNLDLFGGDAPDELEQDDEAASDAGAVHAGDVLAAGVGFDDDAMPADGADDAFDDDEDDDFDDEDRSVPPAPNSAYSRPPAPVLDFGAPDDEPSDPNATTLVSPSGPRPSRPSGSPVSVVDAADDDDDAFSDRAPHAELGFLPEDDEPPVSAQASSADGEDADEVATSSAAFFRHRESTLAPVVDELGPHSDEPLEAALLSPAEARRRRMLRRVVGVGVIGAGLLTLGLVITSSMREQPTKETMAAAVPAPKPPAEKKTAAATEAPPAPEAVVAVDSAPEIPTDVEELEKQTLELLNDRKFEEAIPFAEKLVAARPDNAFGYRCLGSAYQDLGRYADAQKVYSDCATNATKGEVLECTALGGFNKNVKK